MAISLLPKVSEYLSLIMSLVLAFGLVFQLPVVTTLLARVVGLVIVALACQTAQVRDCHCVYSSPPCLTPPDPLSQLGLALPTVLLYEVAIYAARVVERKRGKVAGEEAASDDAEA